MDCSRPRLRSTAFPWHTHCPLPFAHTHARIQATHISTLHPKPPTPLVQLLSLPVIPPFYFPRGGTLPEHVAAATQAQAEAFLAALPQGLTLDNLKAMLKSVRVGAAAGVVWAVLGRRVREGEGAHGSYVAALGNSDGEGPEGGARKVFFCLHSNGGAEA